MAHQSQSYADTVLVTGASGYIAGHIIQQLLQNGYNVRGTVRSLKDHKTKYKQLYDLQNENTGKLELVEANLLSDDKWDDAINGCSYVMSVASPVPRANDKPKQMIETAVEGIKRILSVCLKYKSQIKRFIFTSSVATMVYTAQNAKGPISLFKASDWTELDMAHTYAKSKTIAEREVHKFLSANDNPFECVTLHPSMTIGPLISTNKTKPWPGSVDNVFLILSQQMPALPNVSYGYVDVRDVAKCHVNALTARNANMKRYILSNQHMWYKDVALILKSKYDGVVTRVWPDFFWRMLGMTDETIATWIVPSLGQLGVLADNRQTVKDLDVQFMPIHESVLDTAESLIEHGFVKMKDKKKSVIKTAMQVCVFGATVGAFVYTVKKYILKN